MIAEARSAIRRLTVAATLFALACGDGRNTKTSEKPRGLSDLTAHGTVNARELVEASGIVPSTRVPNTFWSQNDSGNDPLLFAYDSSGTSLQTLRVAGARNRDWEAIAIGPCSDTSCLFIGDVGDNGGRRDEITIWRIREPLPTDTVSTEAVPLRFRYEDGPRDVEAMWIGPDSSVLLLTKRPSRPARKPRMSLVYRLSAAAWLSQTTAVATLVDSVAIVPTASNPRGWITDAALSPPDSTGARQLAVRTYADVFVFDADSGTGRPTTLRHRCNLRSLREEYGEGVTWLADRRLLFVAEGQRPVLYTGRCP